MLMRYNHGGRMKIGCMLPLLGWFEFSGVGARATTGDSSSGDSSLFKDHSKQHYVDYGTTETEHGGSSSEDRKYRGKADMEDCSEISYGFDHSDGAPPPCRLPPSDGASRENTDIASNNGSAYKRPESPLNQLTVSIYVGIAPKAHSIGPLLTNVVTYMWNDDLSNMNFHLHSKYEKGYRGDYFDSNEHNNSFEGQDPSKEVYANYENEDHMDDSGDDDDDKSKEYFDESGHDEKNTHSFEGGNPEKETYQNLEVDKDQQNSIGGDNRALATRYRIRPRGRRYRVRNRRGRRVLEEAVNVFHTKSDSFLMDKHDLRWWWLVNLTYECYWEGNAAPVELELMDVFHTNMSSSFVSWNASAAEILQQITNDRAIRVRMDGIPPSLIDNKDFVSDSPERAPPPADSQSWEWMRYAGLIILTGTFLTALVLRFFSAQRRRQREQTHYWGNLASNEGVDRLLSAGWAVDGGQLLIYDKTKVGYNDDDSVFLGGFEMRETVVGTEVAVTHPETTTTTPEDGPALTSQPSDRSHSFLEK